MRNHLLILSGFLFLILWMIVGYPLEISNVTYDRLLIVSFAVGIAGIIFMTHKLVIRLKYKILKFLLLILLITIALFYSFTGLLEIFISYDDGPVWEDALIYTNKNGQKVISEFRETSGSIYDYRKRLILFEFADNNRISINWSVKRMHGTWYVTEIKNDSSYIENL